MSIKLSPEIDINRALLELEGYQVILINEHRRGLHPWGSMIRMCPLCQKGT